MTPEENEEAISRALSVKTETDYALAEALFLNYTNGYYRLHGYRSVPEFLREHFKGKEQDDAGRMHARGFQRLIREFKLAKEIPAFKAAFDQISRSNRRLIAQVITLENAADWIERALTLTYRELEDLITAAPTEAKAETMVTKRLRLYPGQLEVLERALASARGMLEQEGRDPREVGEGVLVEILCQEFIGTYEAGGYKMLSLFECPGCGKFAPMNRRPEQDVPGGESGSKVVVFECRACGSGVAVKAF